MLVKQGFSVYIITRQQGLVKINLQIIHADITDYFYFKGNINL